MVKYINDIVRDYNIEHHILRNWEDKGYLGVVNRDFQHGRMYDDEQVERILFIQSVVEEQKKRGSKRTDFKRVEHKLFERFGGMVEVKPANILLPQKLLQIYLYVWKNRTSKLNNCKDPWSN